LKVQTEWKANSPGAKREGFVWIIGVHGVLSKEEHDTVDDISSRISHDFVESMSDWHLDLAAHVVSSDNAMKSIVA